MCQTLSWSALQRLLEHEKSSSIICCRALTSINYYYVNQPVGSLQYKIFLCLVTSPFILPPTYIISIYGQWYYYTYYMTMMDYINSLPYNLYIRDKQDTIYDQTSLQNCNIDYYIMYGKTSYNNGCITTGRWRYKSYKTTKVLIHIFKNIRTRFTVLSTSRDSIHEEFEGSDHRWCSAILDTRNNYTESESVDRC